MTNSELKNLKRKVNTIDKATNNLFIPFLKENNISFRNDTTVAIAFFNHPMFYYTLKNLYPKVNFYFIEDISLKFIYDVENSFYVNLEKKEYFPDMKFDYIIMNPPYKGKLYAEILNKIISNDDQAEVICLSPYVFDIFRIRERAFLIFKEGDLADSIISAKKIPHREANDYFDLGNGINDLCIYRCKKHKGEKDIYKYVFNNQIEKNMWLKIFNKIHDECLSWENKNTKRHGEQTPYCVNLYTWHSVPDEYQTCINETEKFSRTLYLDSEDQVNNFKNSFRTKFMKFYIRTIIWAGSGITDKCFMFDKEFYNSPVDDKRFYEFFELTKDEINIIENAII